MNNNPSWGLPDDSSEQRRRLLAMELAKANAAPTNSWGAGAAKMVDAVFEGIRQNRAKEFSQSLAKTQLGDGLPGVGSGPTSTSAPVTSGGLSQAPATSPNIRIVPTQKVSEAPQAGKVADIPTTDAAPADVPLPKARPQAAIDGNKLADAIDAPRPPADVPNVKPDAVQLANVLDAKPTDVSIDDAPRPPADIPKPVAANLAGILDPSQDANSSETMFAPPTKTAALIPDGSSNQRAARMDKSAVGPLIDRVSQEMGYDPTRAKAYVSIESGGNPSARTGSYGGLLQLSKDEMAKYGNGGDVNNPSDNLRAGIASLQDKEARFTKEFGRPPTMNETYMMHQQGEGGLRAHLSNPDAPAWQNMASTGEGRQKGQGWAKAAIWGNVPDDVKRQFGSVDNVSSRDFMNMWAQKVGGGSAMAANPQQPAPWQVAGLGGLTGGVPSQQPQQPTGQIQEASLGLGMGDNAPINRTAQADTNYGAPPAPQPMQQVAQAGIPSSGNISDLFSPQPMSGRSAPAQQQPPQQAPQQQQLPLQAAEAKRLYDSYAAMLPRAQTVDQANHLSALMMQAKQAYITAITPQTKMSDTGGLNTLLQYDPVSKKASATDFSTPTQLEAKRVNERRLYDDYVKQETQFGRPVKSMENFMLELKKAGAITGDTQDAKNRSDLQFAHYKTAISNADAAGQFNSDLNQFLALQGELKAGPLTRQMYDRYGNFLQAIGVGEGEIGKVQGMEAIVARLGPKMRAAGSGATSDWEGRQFLKGLPALANTNEGNAIISSVLTNMNEVAQKRAMLAARQTSPETAMPFQNYIKADQDMVRNSDPLSAWREWSKSVGTYQAPDITTQRDEEMRRRGLK